MHYNCIYKIKRCKWWNKPLDAYANELDKSRTSLVEKAIELYFDTLDEMVADKRIDNLKSGKSTVISLEEVFKQAGIDV